MTVSVSSRTVPRLLALPTGSRSYRAFRLHQPWTIITCSSDKTKYELEVLGERAAFSKTEIISMFGKNGVEKEV